MRDERKGELDSILDAALRDYSNRQPRAGLEQRVAARLHSTSSARGSRWWIGWAAIPVSLAAIALVAITAGRERPKVQPQPSVARVVQLPTPPPSVPTVATVAKITPKSAKLPEPERVPEPETLTPGERALLRFARRDPEQARELFADSGDMKELRIDPLKIEALP